MHIFPSKAKYTGKMVLAVPRCCQKRKGTQDRARVNSRVSDRASHGKDEYCIAVPDHHRESRRIKEVN